MVGSSSSTVLNQDATTSSFSGFSYGAQLEISLTQSNDGDVRLFGLWNQDELKEKSGDFKLTNNALVFGLKFYANRFMFLQAGMGSMTQNFKSSTEDFKVKNSVLSAAVGFDYPISDSLLMGISGQYTVNPIKKTDDIGSNSFAEATQIYLTLTWSPPITIINNMTSSLNGR